MSGRNYINCHLPHELLLYFDQYLSESYFWYVHLCKHTFNFFKCVVKIEIPSFLSSSIYYCYFIGLKLCSVAFAEIKQVGKLFHTLALLKNVILWIFQISLPLSIMIPLESCPRPQLLAPFAWVSISHTWLIFSIMA